METAGDTEMPPDQTWMLSCEHPDFKMEYDKNGVLLNAILFLVLFGDLVLSCPTNCKFCSTGLAECTHISSLEEVLAALPTQTEKVLLRKGTASHIPSEAFQNFSNLNVLSITEFPISSLKNHTFLMRDSERFQFLDLSSNQLTSCGVEASSFTGLKNLTDFTLTNNKLDNLKKSWFFDMWQLQKLNLAFNFISYLPPHTFDNLWQLQKLNLSSNGILYISTGSFFGLLSLTDLDLSSNDMVFINTDAFEPLVSVKHIDVSHNRLKTLPDLPKLVASLLLQNNSWHCSCQFVQLLERLKDKLKDSRTVTCSSPEEAKDSPALMAFAMVCSSNTTDEVLPTITSGPRENGSSWIYGFIGGLLLGFILFLILWLIRKVIKQGILKNPAIQGIESGSIRDKKSSMRLSVTQHDPFSASSNLGFGLRQADQDDIKTPQPMVNLDDVPQNSPNNETDTVGRIRLCKTAPSLLPAPDIFTSSSGSKGGLDAIKLRDSLKYFETDQVDQVTLPPKEMTVHTEVFNMPRGDYYNSASATVNLENPGEMFVKYSTARRSKTWNNLCLTSSSPSSVDHQSTKCTIALTNLSGLTSIKAAGPMTEVHTKKTGEGPGILEEGPRKTGFGLIQDSDDSFSTKIDSCFSNDAFEDNVWCYKTQKNNIQEPGEENTHASESSDSSFLSSLAKSSWAEKDNHHPHDLEVSNVPERRCVNTFSTVNDVASMVQHGVNFRKGFSLPMMSRLVSGISQLDCSHPVSWGSPWTGPSLSCPFQRKVNLNHFTEKEEAEFVPALDNILPPKAVSCALTKNDEFRRSLNQENYPDVCLSNMGNLINGSCNTSSNMRMSKVAFSESFHSSDSSLKPSAYFSGNLCHHSERTLLKEDQNAREGQIERSAQIPSCMFSATFETCSKSQPPFKVTEEDENKAGKNLNEQNEIKTNECNGHSLEQMNFMESTKETVHIKTIKRSKKTASVLSATKGFEETDMKEGSMRPDEKIDQSETSSSEEGSLNDFYIDQCLVHKTKKGVLQHGELKAKVATQSVDNDVHADQTLGKLQQTSYDSTGEMKSIQLANDGHFKLNPANTETCEDIFRQTKDASVELKDSQESHKDDIIIQNSGHFKTRYSERKSQEDVLMNADYGTDKLQRFNGNHLAKHESQNMEHFRISDMGRTIQENSQKDTDYYMEIGSHGSFKAVDDTERTDEAEKQKNSFTDKDNEILKTKAHENHKMDDNGNKKHPFKTKLLLRGAQENSWPKLHHPSKEIQRFYGSYQGKDVCHFKMNHMKREEEVTLKKMECGTNDFLTYLGSHMAKHDIQNMENFKTSSIERPTNKSSEPESDYHTELTCHGKCKDQDDTQNMTCVKPGNLETEKREASLAGTNYETMDTMSYRCEETDSDGHKRRHFKTKCSLRETPESLWLKKDNDTKVFNSHGSYKNEDDTQNMDHFKSNHFEKKSQQNCFRETDYETIKANSHGSQETDDDDNKKDLKNRCLLGGDQESSWPSLHHPKELQNFYRSCQGEDDTQNMDNLRMNYLETEKQEHLLLKTECGIEDLQRSQGNHVAKDDIQNMEHFKTSDVQRITLENSQMDTNDHIMAFSFHGKYKAQDDTQNAIYVKPSPSQRDVQEMSLTSTAYEKLDLKSFGESRIVNDNTETKEHFKTTHGETAENFFPIWNDDTKEFKSSKESHKAEKGTHLEPCDPLKEIQETSSVKMNCDRSSHGIKKVENDVHVKSYLEITANENILLNTTQPFKGTCGNLNVEDDFNTKHKEREPLGNSFLQMDCDHGRKLSMTEDIDQNRKTQGVSFLVMDYNKGQLHVSRDGDDDMQKKFHCKRNHLQKEALEDFSIKMDYSTVGNNISQEGQKMDNNYEKMDHLQLERKKQRMDEDSKKATYGRYLVSDSDTQNGAQFSTNDWERETQQNKFHTETLKCSRDTEDDRQRRSPFNISQLKEEVPHPEWDDQKMKLRRFDGCQHFEENTPNPGHFQTSHADSKAMKNLLLMKNIQDEEGENHHRSGKPDEGIQNRDHFETCLLGRETETSFLMSDYNKSDTKSYDVGQKIVNQNVEKITQRKMEGNTEHLKGTLESRKADDEDIQKKTLFHASRLEDNKQKDVMIKRDSSKGKNKSSHGGYKINDIQSSLDHYNATDMMAVQAPDSPWTCLPRLTQNKYVSVFKLPIQQAQQVKSQQKDNSADETSRGTALEHSYGSHWNAKEKVNVCYSQPLDKANKCLKKDVQNTLQYDSPMRPFSLHQKSSAEGRSETPLPDVDDISVLSNLHYKKISVTKIHQITVQERRDDETGGQESANSIHFHHDKYVQRSLPTKEEFLADRELALINMLYQLRKTLELQNDA